jgi:hypothetical protein
MLQVPELKRAMRLTYLKDHRAPIRHGFAFLNSPPTERDQSRQRHPSLLRMPETGGSKMFLGLGCSAPGYFRITARRSSLVRRRGNVRESRPRWRVAVGTRISPRPPHRSRRALPTHRAPASGQTSCDERFSHARRPPRSHHSDRRDISAQCPNRGRLTAVSLG